MRLRFEQAEKYAAGILFNPTYDFDRLSYHTQQDVRGGMKELSELIPIEIDGGECPTCRKKWMKVTHGGYSQYVPACYCYVVCPACSSRLYEEQLRGDLTHGIGRDKCPQCGWVLYKRSPEGVINSKHWGEYKTMDSKTRERINKHRLEYVADRFGMDYVEQTKGVFKMINGIPFEPQIAWCLTEVVM